MASGAPSGGFRLDDYNTVAERIVEFRTRHPEGSLQQVSLDFREVAGSWWVIYVAAAYRTPDDPRPGIGSAWEPVPGKTNFTRDSELQNAESAAWGRALIAVGAADAKKGIASADEVRARQDDQPAYGNETGSIRAQIAAIGKQMAWTVEKITADFAEWSQGQFITDADVSTLTAYRDYLDEERKRWAREHKQLEASTMGTTQRGTYRKGDPEAEKVERTRKVPEDDPFYVAPEVPANA